MPTPVTLRDWDADYRGRSSSRKHNKAFKQVQADLINIANRQATNEVELINLASAVNFENQALMSRIQTTQSKLDDAKTSYDSGNTHKLMVGSLFDPSLVIAGTANHNPYYGHVTLPHGAVISRIPIIKTPDNRFESIPGVSVEIEEVGGGYETKDRTHEVYKALDHSHNTFWLDERTAGNELVSVRVTFPTPVSPTVNTIVVNPFPEDSVVIKDIQYNSLGSFSQIPGFSEKSIRSMFHFQGIDVSNQFLVDLRNEGSAMTNIYGGSAYPVGLQIMDIGFVDFDTTGYTVMKLDAGAVSASYLTSLTADLELNISGAGSPIDYTRIQVFHAEQGDWASPGAADYDSNTDTYPHTRSIPQVDVRDGASPVASLWVKVTLTKTSNTTPVLKGIRMTYT